MILAVVFLLVLPFALVLLFGAPYLPTRKEQAELALDLLALKKGDVFVDLGCGDGVMLLHAARRGLICYGYELNPFVWLAAWLRCVGKKNVHVHLKNYWKVPLPQHTKGVYAFLLEKYMPKLALKMLQEGKNAKLVSYAFTIPGKKPVKSQKALNLYQF